MHQQSNTGMANTLHAKNVGIGELGNLKRFVYFIAVPRRALLRLQLIDRKLLKP
jgi:hypothetical protein